MREILFRGKRVDTIGNGEWIEGYYAAEPYVENTYNRGYILENEKDLYAKKAYFVDSRTVGQYTGLTDKSGKKIFEGDIVNILAIDKNRVVRFDEGGFCLDAGPLRDYRCFGKMAIEVIGNIHDNPELLEDDK